jgi:hypothetical protein
MEMTAQRARWRFAISLRALMVIVLVLGGGLRWVMNRRGGRREAVRALKDAGGSVLFDYEFAAEGFDPARKSWAPAGLRQIVGDEFFHEVTRVARLDLSPPNGTGADRALAALYRLDRLRSLGLTDPPRGTALTGFGELKQLTLGLSQPGGNRPVHLGLLPSLEEARLNGPGVNDSLLPNLAAEPMLRFLALENTRITDAGLARLDGPANLDALWVSYSGLSDAALPHLVRFRKLNVLMLNGNPRVTDEGVRYLARHLSSLRHLIVGETGVTDAGLASLGGFDALEGLQIDGQGARISDAGLEHLVGLEHLEVLNLSGSGVTDAGLASLQALRRLRWLNLSKTGITDAALAKLSRYTGMKDLFLNETTITDSGLKHIHGLTSLRLLTLDGTAVSLEGVAQLKATLAPTVHISARRLVVALPQAPKSLHEQSPRPDVP